MKSEDDFEEFIINGDKKYVPHLSIDCVIFGFHDNLLKVLILKWGKIDGWSLPGGHVLRGENVEDSAYRILKERTGLTEIYLQQFKTFGKPERTGNALELLFKSSGISPHIKSWLLDRFISIGYYALVDFSKVTPTPDWLSERCSWHDINEIPPMLFDHNEIVDEALKSLKFAIYHQPLGYNLLPDRFTLPQLQKMYETILGKKLDRRNFQKKILSLGILNRLEERMKIGPHRSPFVYSYNKEKYEAALKEGISFSF